MHAEGGFEVEVTREPSIVVVPDSGTGELAGLAGRVSIVIADGAHAYRFDCTLDAAR
jgi:hypothetical protein